MKSSTSTLNPYAKSYVPLFKREVTNDDDKNSRNLSMGVVVSDSKDDDKVEGDVLLAQHSHETGSKIMDEESEMDLAYLQMVFPGVSDESLADVYNLNQGDLDASLDMLSHLEATDNLPDALDAEQHYEPAKSGKCSSTKAGNVTTESPTSDSVVAA